jgi:predicted Zn-dependent peptidase
MASVPNAPQLTARQVYIVDKPGAPQSQIRIGGVGVPRSTPDYYAVQVLNTILGGSFSSRLNQNLREQHGYTYGAGSSFAMRVSAGPFAASSGVQTEVTADALKEFFNELNGILKPVPSAELARSENYVALSFPGEFETAGDIARKIEESIVHRLPEDYFTTYVSRIEAVTAGDVQRAARKYILPDRFAVVIVGDRKAIEAGVRALNLGPVKVMTIQDALGPAVLVQ